jgi:hypothetical protein
MPCGAWCRIFTSCVLALWLSLLFPIDFAFHPDDVTHTSEVIRVIRRKIRNLRCDIEVLHCGGIWMARVAKRCVEIPADCRSFSLKKCHQQLILDCLDDWKV